MRKMKNKKKNRYDAAQPLTVWYSLSYFGLFRLIFSLSLFTEQGGRILWHWIHHAYSQIYNTFIQIHNVLYAIEKNVSNEMT